MFHRSIWNSAPPKLASSHTLYIYICSAQTNAMPPFHNYQVNEIWQLVGSSRHDKHLEPPARHQKLDRTHSFPPSRGSACRIPRRTESEIHLCFSLIGQRWRLLGNPDIAVAAGGNVNGCPSHSLNFTLIHTLLTLSHICSAQVLILT